MYLKPQTRDRIYYGAWDGPHNTRQRNAGIGLATLRKDGFVSLDAGETAGTVTTRLLPAEPEGRLKLTVNAEAAGGSLRVEVLNAQGEFVPGYGKEECEPVRDGGIHQTVRWKDRDVLPAGQRVRLRFWLQNCRLYAFRRTAKPSP